LPGSTVGEENEILCSGRAVAQANQNAAHGNGCEAETDSCSLQWAESAPPASADEVHRRDAKDEEQAKCNDNDTELALGDHARTL
jgi:hypothetical protein